MFHYFLGCHYGTLVQGHGALARIFQEAKLMESEKTEKISYCVDHSVSSH